MKTSPWIALFVRICLLIALTFAAYFAIRQGVGAWYFRQGSPDALQTAIRWDPGNPQYYDALGNLNHFYADRANPAETVHLFETASRLSPNDAQYWADLGAAYDWAGRPKDALHSLERSEDMFPDSPDINWRLANFYIREGRVSDGLHSLRKVLLADSISRQQVFALSTSATDDNKAILDQMLPLRTPDYVDFLNFRVQTGNIDAAMQTWARMMQLNLPFDVSQALPYLDGLIHHEEFAALANAWTALETRFPTQVRARMSPPSLITNGNFAMSLLDGGLDWRVIPTDGVTASEDDVDLSTAPHALRISFDGAQNLNYGGVYQFVPVKPGTRYRFAATTRVEDVTTDSGPRVEIFDAYDMSKLFVSTRNLVGTTDWSQQQLEFTTSPSTRLIIVRVARPLSQKFDNKIAGSFWISHVSLDPTESAVQASLSHESAAAR